VSGSSELSRCDVSTSSISIGINEIGELVVTETKSMNHLMHKDIHVLFMNYHITGNFEHISVDHGSGNQGSFGSACKIAVHRVGDLATTGGLCIKVDEEICGDSGALEDRRSASFTDFANTGSKLQVSNNRGLNFKSALEVVNNWRNKRFDI